MISSRVFNAAEEAGICTLDGALLDGSLVISLCRLSADYEGRDLASLLLHSLALESLELDGIFPLYSCALSVQIAYLAG